MNINDNRAHSTTLDSQYIDLENVDNEFKNCTYCALHINIHGLHFILRCETLLTEANAELFLLPGYSFSHNCRKSRSKGGIAL